MVSPIYHEVFHVTRAAPPAKDEVIAGNKIRCVRAGLAYSPFAVRTSRGNNHASVMAFGTKVVSGDKALELVGLRLATPLHGGRRAGGAAQITALEDIQA